MQSEGNANHFVSIGINFGVTLLSIVPTWIVLSELEGSHEIIVVESDQESNNEGKESAEGPSAESSVKNLSLA